MVVSNTINEVTEGSVNNIYPYNVGKML
jgi:hypothetical protein